MHGCGGLKTLLLFAISLPLLSACLLNGPYPYKLVGGALYATSTGFFSDPKVNLKEKNYAAADMLQSRFGKELARYHTIKAVPLEELDHPGISSPLGRNISEGVGLRLSELGYRVMLQDVAPYDNAELYPQPTKKPSPDYILRGYYAVKTDHIDVTLQVINLKTNIVTAYFEYAMTLSREIKTLAETPAQIFRVQE